MKPHEADKTIATLQKLWSRAPWGSGRVRWDILRESLLADDPEAIDYAAKAMEPKERRRRERAQAAAVRKEERERQYEAQGIDLDEYTHLGPAAIDRLAEGKVVWLYHGTTSRFLRRIKRDGLEGGINRIDAKNIGVYLTAKHGSWINQGGSAVWYAERAAGYFGGDPVVLRVLVHYDSLEWDTDDEDIESGNYQWVTDSVPPDEICEVNGKRIRGRCKPCQ